MALFCVWGIVSLRVRYKCGPESLGLFSVAADNGTDVLELL